MFAKAGSLQHTKDHITATTATSSGEVSEETSTMGCERFIYAERIYSMKLRKLRSFFPLKSNSNSNKVSASTYHEIECTAVPQSIRMAEHTYIGAVRIFVLVNSIYI